ncbi:YcaO-like family protein [Candidatus Halobonum tyrrellensis]|uniref:YcaO domain-containing protein n=1 Tax=Candidatus Halobonum tyrrellensis G22 TaxID=1324957 RepID=V4HDX2_9EURY|nr:YcaO-like family protein [Candidatus Halobonum tyrrellensis]ESP88855.1 hypothetical protein K933_07157 [Candidatus Halobonum tyrrellensis G22]
MDIAIVGPDPAAAALRGAFSDVDVNAMEVTVDQLDGFDFGVVVGTAGDAAFETANDALGSWAAVEVGGVGGRPVEGLHAAVSLFSPDSGCYDCLCDRAAATSADGAEPRGTKSAVRFAGALAGRRVIRQLSGEDLAGTTVEVPGRERGFLPSPGCDCGARPTGFELSYREVDLNDAVARMDRAVDDRLGPVAEVGERESFPVPYYVARTADTTRFSDARCAEFGAGVAADWNSAYAKAIGEALERYCAGVYRASEWRTAPTEGVIDAVPVDRFVRPDDAPTPAADERVAWVDGYDLASGESASLPAAFVHFPPPGETRYKPPITTGLALGNSTVEAALSGLYETVERDASMLAWYSTFDPMTLDVDDERFDALRRRARAEALSVTPLLLTQDVDVPVVGVAVHRDDEWPRFAMGSAASLDAAGAAANALAEALQNWTELRSMGPDAAAEEEGAIAEYAGFPDRAREFLAGGAAVPAAELGGDADGEAELETLLARLGDAGLDAYAARLTTRDVADLGFEAVRVLVPEAQPLFTGEPFFGDRLDSVPESMGFEPRPDRAYHPFP